jgi:hypothetical protein
MDTLLPDLWTRLARIDRCCDIVAMSLMVGHQRHGWIVRVYQRNHDKPPLVEMRGSSLVGPLAAAVLAVEQRGWAFN